MAQTQSIAWKRLSVEAFAIVFSILLAFAIDAWWDERKERQFEQETLVGLEAEYEDHRINIEQQTANHRIQLGAVGRLMEACQSGTYAALDMLLDDALYWLLVPVTTDLGSGVRDSLISAGRIEVLRNRDLRYALSEWDSVLDEVVDGQFFSLNLVRESFIPLLSEDGISTAHGAHNKDRHPWPVSTRPISSFGDKHLELFKNIEFCRLLDHRYSHMNHTLDEFENLLEAIVDMLSLIRSSMDENTG